MAVFKIDMSKRALQPFGKMKKDKVKQNEGKAKKDTATIMVRYFEVDGRTGRRICRSLPTTCLH